MMHADAGCLPAHDIDRVCTSFSSMHLDYGCYRYWQLPLAANS